MQVSPLQLSLERYETAIASLPSTPKLTEAEAIEILIARDEVQAILNEKKELSGEILLKISQLDRQLQENTAKLAPFTQSADWRKSFSPDEKAWWWFLEVPPLNWLWSAFSVTCLTISLGLVGEISSRFLTGGPDTLGALTVSLQSVLTLLAAGGALTKAGQEANKRLLKASPIPEKYWHELGAFFSFLVLLGLIGLRLSLPQIAAFYNNWGDKNYKAGDLGSAEENFQRALQLNPDDADAHHNLGLLYENLQNFDAARTQYRLAMQGGQIPAINNLARLQILDKNYSAAVNLLLKAESEPNLDNETKYAILKNLGWARLKQGDYQSAETNLLDAIALQQSAKLEENIASPHCLLAQVKEAQGDKVEALKEWETCNQYANGLNPDENDWRITAQKRLVAKEKQK